MKTIFFLSFILIFLVSGCNIQFPSGTAEIPEEPTAATESAEPFVSAEDPAEPADDPGEEALIAAEAAAASAVQTSELYKDLYLQDYEPDMIRLCLKDQTMRDILARLEAEGCIAVDFSGKYAMVNSEAVSSFRENYLAGEDTEIVIYQIDWDGGFLRHHLSAADNSVKVVRTRLAWLQDGPFAVPGEIPTVTYSEQYAVTKLDFSNDHMNYTYFMPDNPVGGNHDGHVDTEVSLSIR